MRYLQYVVYGVLIFFINFDNDIFLIIINARFMFYFSITFSQIKYPAISSVNSGRNGNTGTLSAEMLPSQVRVIVLKEYFLFSGIYCVASAGVAPLHQHFRSSSFPGHAGYYFDIHIRVVGYQADIKVLLERLIFHPQCWYIQMTDPLIYINFHRSGA